MRKSLAALTGAILFATAGAAFAQSQQGGYLGENPGAGVAVSHADGTMTAAGQGASTGDVVSPNNSSYAANGAPRAGAPAPDGSYQPIMHQHHGG